MNDEHVVHRELDSEDDEPKDDVRSPVAGIVDGEVTPAPLADEVRLGLGLPGDVLAANLCKRKHQIRRATQAICLGAQIPSRDEYGRCNQTHRDARANSAHRTVPQQLLLVNEEAVNLQSQVTSRRRETRAEEKVRVAEPRERVHHEKVEAHGQESKHAVKVAEHHTPADVLAEGFLEHRGESTIAVLRGAKSTQKVSVPRVCRSRAVVRGLRSKHLLHGHLVPEELVDVVVADARV